MALDKELEILHDHYKETFARVREVEASRNRLFLWVIGLYALLILEIGYSATIGSGLGSLNLVGLEINLRALPLPALLDATWVLTLAIVLRYCQASIFVERQYPYVHLLERSISSLVRRSLSLNENVYQREGKVYLNEYPVLLDVAWIAYVVVFPLILIVATVGLLCWEWTRLPYPWPHKVFDSLVTAALLTFFVLYRVQPYVANRWRRRRKQRRNK